MMFIAFQNLAESELSKECDFNKSLNTSECKVDMLHLSDSTLRNPPYGIWLTIFLAALAGSVVLIIIAGNLTVLLAFGLTRKLRQANNYFLVSLAVTDLLVGIICVPMFAQYLLRGVWVLGPWFCDIWLSFDWTLCFVSRLNVLLITLDRFLSLKIPGKYRNWRSVGKVQVLIGITWIVPVLICFPTIMGWQYFVGERSIRADKCDVQFTDDLIFTLILVLCSYWIVLFVMFILYGVIFKVAWSLSRRLDMRRMHAEDTSWTFAYTYDDTTREVEEVSAEEFNNSAIVSHICSLKTKSDNKVDKSQSFGNSKLSYSSRLRTAINPIFNTRKEEDIDNQNLGTFVFDADKKCSTSKEVWKSPSGFSHCTGTYILGSETVETKGLVDSIQGDLSFGAQLQRSVSHISLSHPSSKLHETPVVPDCVFGRSSSSGHSDLLVFPIFGRHKKQTTPLIPKDKSGCKFTEKKSLNNLDCEHVASESYRDNQARDDFNVSGRHTPPVRKPTLSCFPRTPCVVDLKVHNLPITTELTASSDLFLASGKRVVTGANEDISQNLRISCLNTRNQTTVSTTTAVNANGEPISGRLFLAEKLNKTINNKSVNSGQPDRSFADINNSHADNASSVSMPRRVISRSRSLLKSIFSLHHEPDNRARKTLRAISLILGAYTLCWTPYHVYIVVYTLCTDCGNPHIYTFTYWLCYLNSAINPFCYAFANPYFRVAFLRIMQLSWDRT